jgi:hypothetical protein
MLERVNYGLLSDIVQHGVGWDGIGDSGLVLLELL